jgi:5'-nucleotidase
MFTRRKFIKDTTLLVGAGLVANPLTVWANRFFNEEDYPRLTLLHTNDQHSRIDPFPEDDKRNANMGGFARRATLIKEVRQNQKNVLLLDAGDIFQGTPYFNLYGGELEFKLMSQMGYNAATMGNHDFDLGLEGFHKQLPHAQFDFLNCNYNLTDTILNNKLKTHAIYNFKGIKIGVTGVGIKLDGLVSPKQYGNTRYNDPIESANKMAEILKNDYKCNLVVCLSHLGFKYKKEENQVSDHDLAAQSKNIDLIIGGHTHTFLKQPDVVRNLDNKEVIVTQAGWGGILLGRLDFVFLPKDQVKCLACNFNLIDSQLEK